MVRAQKVILMRERMQGLHAISNTVLFDGHRVAPGPELGQVLVADMQDGLTSSIPAHTETKSWN